MKERIALIGAGRVGRSLAAALAHAGLEVALVIDRRAAAAEAAASVCGAAAGSDPAALKQIKYSLLILAVPDDAIAAAAAELAAAGVVAPGTMVVHCSGSLPAGLLEPLRPHTRRLASMHPLQSFAGREEEWRRWSGIHIALEGEEGTLASLEQIVLRMQSRPFRLPAEAKTFYHIACVLLSNGLVGLYAAADELLEGVDLPAEEKRAMTEPLVRNTIANVIASGPAAALTGPVSRGDIGTVSNHLRALAAEQPGLLELYRTLSLRLLKLAEQEGRLTLLQREALTNLLDYHDE